MLDEVEFQLVEEARLNGASVLERERQRRGLWRERPIVPFAKIPPELQVVLEMYRLLTGFPETVPAAVAHHVISMYGPPCPRCTKPLRTPKAKFCAACGFGMDDMASDPRQLHERRPSLFP
jgi:hypothetical protein